jgi:hypothetical protein
MDKFFDWMEKHFWLLVCIAGVVGLVIGGFGIWGLFELIAWLRRN